MKRIDQLTARLREYERDEYSFYRIPSANRTSGIIQKIDLKAHKIADCERDFPKAQGAKNNNGNSPTQSRGRDRPGTANGIGHS